jgi:predicted permease
MMNATTHQHQRGTAAIVAVTFLATLVAIKVLLAWVAATFAPGVAEHEMAAGASTWGTAMKFALPIALLVGFLRGHWNRSRRGRGQRTPDTVDDATS